METPLPVRQAGGAERRHRPLQARQPAAYPAGDPDHHPPRPARHPDLRRRRPGPAAGRPRPERHPRQRPAGNGPGLAAVLHRPSHPHPGRHRRAAFPLEPRTGRLPRPAPGPPRRCGPGAGRRGDGGRAPAGEPGRRRDRHRRGPARLRGHGLAAQPPAVQQPRRRASVADQDDRRPPLHRAAAGALRRGLLRLLLHLAEAHRPSHRYPLPAAALVRHRSRLRPRPGRGGPAPGLRPGPGETAERGEGRRRRRDQRRGADPRHRADQPAIAAADPPGPADRLHRLPVLGLGRPDQRDLLPRQRHPVPVHRRHRRSGHQRADQPARLPRGAGHRGGHRGPGAQPARPAGGIGATAPDPGPGQRLRHHHPAFLCHQRHRHRQRPVHPRGQLGQAAMAGGGALGRPRLRPAGDLLQLRLRPDHPFRASGANRRRGDHRQPVRHGQSDPSPISTARRSSSRTRPSSPGNW